MKHGIRLLLITILLWPAAACHDMYSDLLDSRGLGVFIVAPPVMVGLSALSDSNSILLAPPVLISGWLPAPTITAYIGEDGTIQVSGTTVTGAIKTAVMNEAAGGYLFDNLTMGVTHRIIVVAQNALGASVQQIVKATYTPIAVGVYGQGGDFTTRSSGHSADIIRQPFDVAVDGNGVYIADHYNNRVLYFMGTSTTATRVYGQDDFTQNSPNKGGGVNATTLNGPTGVAVDYSGVYIVDCINNRVLFYPGTSTTATRVYGQDDFTQNSLNKGGGPGGQTPDTLNGPIGVTVDAGGVYIADNGNNRVLHYAGSSTSPDRLYGDGSGTSLALPHGVAVYAGGIYIADTNNNRVLHYTGTSITADLVYSSLGTNPCATSLNYPFGVAADASGVYIADYHNNRVLHYWRGLTTATGVYGQGGNLDTNNANYPSPPGNVTATSLYNPYGLAVYGGSVYIADYGNYRVLRY